MTDQHMSNHDLRRYGRHLSLPGVGPAGQQKLLDARVLVIGAGGLGSPALLYLAAAGIGTLGIIDPDVVELSNLQRQVLHNESGCGTPKVESAVAAIKSLNSGIKVETFQEHIDSSNAVDIVSRFDVVVDGTDNFTTRHVVGDACYLAGVPSVWGSVFQFQGQVSVFPAGGRPCYRCLYPEPPPAELAPSCAEGGVFGALCATVGSVQAAEVLKLIIGIGEPLIGRVWSHDGWEAKTRVLSFPPRDDCVLCGPNPTVTSVEEVAQVCGVESQVPTLNTSSLETLLAQREAGERSFDLVDVREPFEWDIAQISGATNVPLQDFIEGLGDRDPSRQIILYCKSGARSERAATAALSHGLPVSHLDGGIIAWSRDVLGTELTY